MGEHFLQSLPMQAFLGHHGTLALSIYEHFAAYSGPLFHFHIHASFLMRVPVLVCLLLCTGFQPAFTTDQLRDRIMAFIDYYNATMAKPFKWMFKGFPA